MDNEFIRAELAALSDAELVAICDGRKTPELTIREKLALEEMDRRGIVKEAGTPG